jgi:hypothetical protein
MKRRGRPRKAINAWMPPNVEEDAYGFALHRRASGEFIRIAGKDATRAEVWTAYERTFQNNTINITYVIGQYFIAHNFVH